MALPGEILASPTMGIQRSSFITLSWIHVFTCTFVHSTISGLMDPADYRRRRRRPKLELISMSLCIPYLERILFPVNVKIGIHYTGLEIAMLLKTINIEPKITCDHVILYCWQMSWTRYRTEFLKSINIMRSLMKPALYQDFVPQMLFFQNRFMHKY